MTLQQRLFNIMSLLGNCVILQYYSLSRLNLKRISHQPFETENTDDTELLPLH